MFGYVFTLHFVFVCIICGNASKGSTSFLTDEILDLTWGDHGNGLPWSFLSDFGSIEIYWVLAINIWSSPQTVDVLLLAFVEFLHTTWNYFQA